MFQCLSPRSFSLEDEVKLCPKCRRPLTATKVSLQDNNQDGKSFYICTHCGITIQANVPSDPQVQDTLRLVSQMNDTALKENIIRSYMTLFQSKSMTGIQDTHNEAKLLMSCYSGSDLEPMLTLFHETKNLILYLLLGQKMCQHAIQTESSRIDTNKAILQETEKKSRDLLAPIMNQLQQKSLELKNGHHQYVAAEKSTLVFKTQVEDATGLKAKLQQLLKSENTILSDADQTKLAHDYVDVQKTLKTAEARWTISKQVCTQEKALYQKKEQEISESVSGLKDQLVQLQKHLVDSKAKVTADISYSNKMIAQAKAHLAQIQILSFHVQDHAENWIDNAFVSIHHMEDLKQGIMQLIECIKFLVQDHFPTSIQDMNEECQLFTVDIMDMRLRQFEFTSTTCCDKCALPKIVNAEAGVEFCMICPPTPTTVETSLDIPTPPSTTMEDDTDRTNAIKSPPLYNLNTAVAERLLAKEIVRRVSNGWSTQDQPICEECGTQQMMDPSHQMVPCILCNADTFFLQRIVTREIGILVQKGWYLHESSCPECGVLFMSSALDSPAQCIVCEQVL